MSSIESSTIVIIIVIKIYIRGLYTKSNGGKICLEICLSVYFCEPMGVPREHNIPLCK